MDGWLENTGDTHVFSLKRNQNTVKETYTGTFLRRVLATPVWNGLYSWRA